MKLLRLLAALAAVIMATGCGGGERKASGQVRHYQLVGKVVSVDAQHQTASIDAAAIPNFMDAMTMDYPIKSKDDFGRLHAGERITATVEVTAEESYSLSDVRPQPAGK